MPLDIAPARIALGIDATVNAHKPVMLAEALAGLALGADGFYLDCTFGRGGHSAAILDALGPQGRLLALDQDPQAIAHGRERFAEEPRLILRHCNFAELGSAVHDSCGARGVDGILMDLGVSSPQLDEAQRGFSFTREGPLDMRMNPQAGESAAAWLARAKEEEIADVLWQYGDERNSRRIARRIVESRTATPLLTTTQLAALIAAVPGPRSRTIHPATRSFQAIRIHINRELDVLRTALTQAIAALAPGGRLVVISFHSLEDRIVKHFLRDTARADQAPIKLLGKQFPGREEERENPRSRSAVLRIAEKLGAPA